MSLRNIVEKTGGDLYAGGRQANIPAPGHSERDRSVSLKLGDNGQVLVHTWAGTDWREVMDDLRRRGLIDGLKRPVGKGGTSRTVHAVVDPDPIARLKRAREIWSGGREATPRTLSYQHTRLRHIDRPLPGCEVMRHSTGAPLRAFDPVSTNSCPALLVAISDVNGEFGAVEITFLDPNARRSRRITLSRKTVGPFPPGGAIRIDPAESEMAVGEGFFSTLSGSERFSVPAWALRGYLKVCHTNGAS